MCNSGLNEDFVGELGYVVNFCAPDDLLDGCYQLIVDEGDPSQIAWQIQNAEISVFALTGSSYFDSTSIQYDNNHVLLFVAFIIISNVYYIKSIDFPYATTIYIMGAVITIIIYPR